jgi:hypothetical protein
MLKHIPHLKNSMDIQSGQFLPLKASAKKKRQTSNMSDKEKQKIICSFFQLFIFLAR